MDGPRERWLVEFEGAGTGVIDIEFSVIDTGKKGIIMNKTKAMPPK